MLIPAVSDALATFAETGLIGISLPESVGGMQLPHVIQSAAFAWFQAANVGTSAYPFLTLAAANMLIECGSPEQVARWVERAQAEVDRLGDINRIRNGRLHTDATNWAESLQRLGIPSSESPGRQWDRVRAAAVDAAYVLIELLQPLIV